MAHRRIAVVIFGVLVLAVPLAGPGVATPIATSTIAQPMEQAPATLAPCPAAEAGTILAQSDCCVRARGVCGCRGGRAVCCNGSAGQCPCRADDSAEDPPIVAPRQAR